MLKCRTMLAMLVAVVALTGCAIEPRYRASVTSSTAGAKVIRASGTFSKFVTLEGVDGLPLHDLMPPPSILIDPGMRMLSVRCVHQRILPGGGNFAEADLWVMLSAGHTYRLQCDRTEGDSMTFWVEDAVTKELVGAKKPAPTQPLQPNWTPSSADVLFQLLKLGL